MRARFVLLVLPVLATVPCQSQAQRESTWRFGGALVAPGTVLDIASNGDVGVGIGVAGEAARVWTMQSQNRTAVVARLSTAGVDITHGGDTWSPGRAFFAELVLRGEFPLRARSGLFGGIGISHWAGPEETVPFSGATAALFLVEGGGWLRHTGFPWAYTLTANLTRMSPDESRGVQSGFVLRLMLGAQHAK